MKKWIYVIPFLIFIYLSTAFNDVARENKPKKTFVVVLDAGHGGYDPGTLGNGYVEKNIALNIVLKAGAVLEKDPSISVVYTRKDDIFVNLYQRGEIANKVKADLFVSVHCDSHTSNVQGAGTFVLGLHANKQNFEIAKKENSAIYLEDDYETRYAEYDINSPESIIGFTIMQEEFLDQSIALAKQIQDKFSNKLKRMNRKVKQAGFIVLHQTFMPSVLVETGFLTNKKEGAYLNSKKGQLEMGIAIAEAILDYKRKFVEVTEIKEIAIKNKPEEKASKNIANIIFKVQIFAISRNLSLESDNFKGLNKLSKERHKSLYKYLYGSTNSYFQAKRLKSNADIKGFTASFIVAYKDGKRILLSKALKYVKE